MVAETNCKKIMCFDFPLYNFSAAVFQKSLFLSHQLSSNGEAGTVLLGQFDFDRLGALDCLQGSGKVLWSHFQTNLIVLRGHTLHLVFIKEVGL